MPKKSLFGLIESEPPKKAAWPGLKENVPDVPKAASQPKLAPTLEDFFSDDD